MSGPLEVLEPELRERVRRADPPSRAEPMLATLVHERFSDPDWIFERKLDGVRILVFQDGGEVRLRTRNGEERGGTYPELVEALEGHGPDLVADGEVVAFEGSVTSFSRLQERMRVEDPEEARRRAARVAVKLYLFDLLHVDDHDLTDLPLRARKRVLRESVRWEDPVRWTPHRNEEGEAYWEEACRKGWEGVIAKDADSPYVHGRSRRWLKFKCGRRQELVVGGFTEPRGSRVGFGALLLGYHDDGAFRYAGKVGTGWDDETLRRLRERMDGLERHEPPFDAGDPPAGDDVHWIRPELVAEVGFTEWTDDGRLRHPRYLGLREDKDPEEVVRERPADR
jgi:bifunctional non-homologous end joining protein LigD